MVISSSRVVVSEVGQKINGGTKSFDSGETQLGKIG
jgi:hypothetical protein